MGRTHLAALEGLDDVRVTVVAEPHEPTALELSDHGFTVVASAREIALRDDVDGYLIATPSALHGSVVDDLVVARKPILCEKPAGLSVADAEKIRSATEDAGVRLQIGYWRRFVPALVKLRTEIARGHFGRVLSIHAGQWDHRPPAPAFRNASGGIFRDMGVHEIDVIRWLTGHEVASIATTRIVSRDSAVDDEDAATMMLTLTDGTLGIATLGRFFPHCDAVWVDVLGDAGHRRVDVLSAETDITPQMDALREQAVVFARGGKGAATIDDAIATLRILEKISAKDRE